MPIVPSTLTRRISQAEFAEIAYEVLKHVFAIHADFGRFFDEFVYKRELAARMSYVETEASIEVSYRTFSKMYHADVLVAAGGLFEFKAAEAIHPKHRAQAIHYLHLLDLAHGKVINVRPELVQHEFVNCHQRLCELKEPLIDDADWDSSLSLKEPLREIILDLVWDWGTGLDVTLYEEAVTHFLGGESTVEVPIPVLGASGKLGHQIMRLAAPDIAFKITTHPRPDESFRIHAHRLLKHTPLKSIQWINIANHQVTFTTIHH